MLKGLGTWFMANMLVQMEEEQVSPVREGNFVELGLNAL